MFGVSPNSRQAIPAQFQRVLQWHHIDGRRDLDPDQPITGALKSADIWAEGGLGSPETCRPRVPPERAAASDRPAIAVSRLIRGF
jgi:hypothetical protein